MAAQDATDTASDFAECQSSLPPLDQYMRKADIQGLATLTLGVTSLSELDWLVPAAFSSAAASRSALLVLVEDEDAFGDVARVLQPAMLRPVHFRPLAVSIVVPPACKLQARELSFALALEGIILGDFTDAARATNHALSWRRVVLLEESSSPRGVRSLRHVVASRQRHWKLAQGGSSQGSTRRH